MIRKLGPESERQRGTTEIKLTTKTTTDTLAEMATKASRRGRRAAGR